MATLITFTIASSFVVSMVLFGALMHIIGPQDECGDILWFLRPKNTSTNNEIEMF